MEKVLQIIAVFVLMTFVIHRMIRGREPRYLSYNYVTRLRPPLMEEIARRLVTAVFEAGQAEAIVIDEARRLLFSYNAEGSLTIHQRKEEGQLKEMQVLAAPLDCTAMALDPVEGKLYLEAAGFLFVYGA
jgi:hypothetical protein